MSTLLGTLAQDARYGLRNLARNPAFTIVAMLTLALGIGANTTIFSVIDNTLLKPLPFPDPGRLVLVFATYGKNGGFNVVSAPNFWDFQRQSRSFESMAIFDSAGRGYNLSTRGAGQEAEQVSGLRVSAGFFSVLGVKPFLGRTLSRRFPMFLLSVFSALALTLAAVGIVGVVGHSVAQRSHEIGIRMALGAGTADVLRLMVSGNMAWVLAGLTAGVAGAAALTRLLAGLLYEVRPLDPMVLGGVSLLLFVVALLASYLPARRATKIDPTAALRCE